MSDSVGASTSSLEAGASAAVVSEDLDRELAEFREWLRDEGLRVKTVAGYVGQVRRWKESGIERMAWLRENIRDKTTGTASQVRSAIRAYVRWTEGDAAADMLRMPRSRRASTLSKAPLTVDQAQALQRRLHASSKLPRRSKVILTLILLTGLRPFEACALRGEQLCRRSGVRGFLLVGKGGSERFVPVVKEVLEIIDAFLAAEKRTRSGPLFPGRKPGSSISTDRLYADLREFRHADEDGLTAHALRHTFATRGLNAGAALNDVRVLLGHADLQTTTIYARPDEQTLNQTMKTVSKVLAQPKRRRKRKGPSTPKKGKKAAG